MTRAREGHRVDAVRARGRVAEQRLVGGGGAGVQCVGVGQPVLLRAQGRCLARDRVELLDVHEACPQFLGLGGAGPRLRRQGGELVEHLAVPPVGVLVVGEHLGEDAAGVLVQRLALPAGLEQLLLV
jgi:hypothetical protein